MIESIKMKARRFTRVEAVAWRNHQKLLRQRGKCCKTGHFRPDELPDLQTVVWARYSTVVTCLQTHSCSGTSVVLDILVIAPHPDDAELGMGGAIVKFCEEGRKAGLRRQEIPLESGKIEGYPSSCV